MAQRTPAVESAWLFGMQLDQRLRLDKSQKVAVACCSMILTIDPALASMTSDEIAQHMQSCLGRIALPHVAISYRKFFTTEGILPEMQAEWEKLPSHRIFKRA